jgi:Protein of unknown function (DUF3093)
VSAPEPVYRERLTAPWWLWLVCSAFVISLGIAFGYPLGWPAGVLAGLVAEALVAWVLLTAAARIWVGPETFVAARANLPFQAIGDVTALDDAAAALLRGRGADPRAYLLLRPWISRAVRVEVDDAADPTPYWYVSTRRPEALAVALAAARDSAAGRHDGDRSHEAG